MWPVRGRDPLGWSGVGSAAFGAGTECWPGRTLQGALGPGLGLRAGVIRTRARKVGGQFTECLKAGRHTPSLPGHPDLPASGTVDHCGKGGKGVRAVRLQTDTTRFSPFHISIRVLPFFLSPTNFPNEVRFLLAPRSPTRTPLTAYSVWEVGQGRKQI